MKDTVMKSEIWRRDKFKLEEIKRAFIIDGRDDIDSEYIVCVCVCV